MKIVELIKALVTSLSGVLFLLGIIAMLLSGLGDWNSMLENIGLALTASGITTFLYRYNIDKLLSAESVRKYGIETVKPGRNAALEYVGGLDAFLGRANPHQIDIMGIAMYSLFEPNDLYHTLLDYAKRGYKIRLVFADPDSTELRLQEEAEGKVSTLKHHIEQIEAKLQTILNTPKYSQDRDVINSNINLYYSRTLPKVFILRSGNKMIATQYFLRGPHSSPSYILSKVPDGAYIEFASYFENAIEDLTIRKLC